MQLGRECLHHRNPFYTLHILYLSIVFDCASIQFHPLIRLSIPQTVYNLSTTQTTSLWLERIKPKVYSYTIQLSNFLFNLNFFYYKKPPQQTIWKHILISVLNWLQFYKMATLQSSHSTHALRRAPLQTEIDPFCEIVTMWTAHGMRAILKAFAQLDLWAGQATGQTKTFVKRTLLLGQSPWTGQTSSRKEKFCALLKKGAQS